MHVMCQRLHIGGLQKEEKIEVINDGNMLNAFFTLPGWRKGKPFHSLSFLEHNHSIVVPE